MSTAQLYLFCDNSSAANYRNWGEGISLQLTAAGWTKTSDTGQVDWTTNPAVPANGSFNYEIRKPASDSLQTGTTAYFIKIEYGSGSGPSPSIRITIGNATNGAGTLTGIVGSAVLVTNNGGATNTGTTPWECNFSWDVNRLGVMMWRNHSTASSPCFFGFDRTKNTDGTDSSDGVTVLFIGNNIHHMQTLLFGNSVTPLIAHIITIDTNVSPLAFNNSIPLSPVFPMYGKFGNPMTIAGEIAGGDAAEGALLTTTLYGATKTYMMTKVSGLAVVGSANTGGLIMRFD